MGKLRDLWFGEHKGFVRYATVATVIAMLYIVFFAQDSIVRWMKAKNEIRRQDRQIEWYQQEIAAMDEQIRTLSTDRDTLERYARENFHFAAPGDDVYLEQ